MKISRIALYALTAAGIWVAGQAQAVLVDFTSPDYVDGNLSNNVAWNADANVNNHGSNMVVTAAAGYDGALGVVMMDSIGNWTDNILTEPFLVAGEDDALTITSRFQYDASSATPSGWLAGIYGLVMFTSPDGYTDNIRVMVQRMGNGNIELITFSNGQGNPYPFTGAVPEAGAGVTGGTGTSDWLELSVTFVRGSDLSNWKIIMSLYNLDTGTFVVPEASYDIAAPANYSTDTFYAALSSVQPAQANVSQVRVDTFEVVEGTAPIPPVEIICGSLGNGDFEAFVPPVAPDTGAVLYSQVPNWYVAGFDDTAFNFTFTNAMNSRAASTWNQRLNVNDSGHVVQSAGEVFSVDYLFVRFGNPYLADGQTNRTYLFTVDNDDPVDADLSGNNMTPVAGSENFFYPEIDGGSYYQPVSHPDFYTTTAADIGKTFYFCSQFRRHADSGAAPRIDDVCLTVQLPPPTVDIICGTTGNGDFEAYVPPVAPTTGGVPYNQVPNWFLAGGDDAAFNFTFTNAMNSRAASTWNVRLNVNDSGHTVQAAGEVFNLDYLFVRYGNPYTADGQTNRTYLFTVDNDDPVDADLSGNNMTPVAGSENFFYPDTAGTSYYQPVSHPAFYTTTAADIGKTFYFCSQFLRGEGSGAAPRIDNVCLTVELEVNPLTGWAKFVDDYSLTTNKTDHADADGLNNWGEYVFGGDPTNSTDVGTQPSFNPVLGVYNYSLIGDDSVVAHVVITESLVPVSWTTNKTENVSENDGAMHEYGAIVGTIQDTQFFQLLVE